ncbi:MAG: F0F1 ATP synthase subunit A [Deltaproteobacteria bacterium]
MSHQAASAVEDTAVQNTNAEAQVEVTTAEHAASKEGKTVEHGAEKESLGSELTAKMQKITYESIKVEVPGFDILNYHMKPFTINFNESILTMWFLTAIIIIGAILITRKFEKFPGKVQNFAEALVEGINSLAKSMIGHHWKPFAPYFGTIIIFLAFCNTIGMLGIPEFHIGGFLFPGLRPPTKDINLPAALALMTILLVIGSQLKYKGIGGTIKSWFEPIPIMLPFKLMEYIIKPLSLCLRLFGNVFGAFVMMELITIVSRRLLLPPIFSLYFDIFDGLLQAFIFTFLSMLYIEEAIE